MARTSDAGADGAGKRAGAKRSAARTRQPGGQVTPVTPVAAGTTRAARSRPGAPGPGADNGPDGVDDVAGDAGNGADSAIQATARPTTTGVAAAAVAESRQRRPTLRTRILPRGVLGISTLILAFAIGCGFSGVVLFSYYQYKLNQTNQRVNTLVSGYKKQFTNAEGQLAAAAAAAKADIQSQLKSIQQLQAGPSSLATLVKQMATSVFVVHTQDVNGQPSVGTAFVVSSSSGQSLLLTSYSTVAAATRAPSPPVYIRQGNTDVQVTVHSWDPQYDLALLVLQRGGLKALAAAPPQPAPQPGDKIYAVSGSGSSGASLTQGAIVDVSASGIAEDAAIGTAFSGGPLINQSGQVVAVGSRAYAPLGFASQGVWYAPYVEAACNKVLTCPNGTLVGAH
jgi:hypothetical protein